MGQMAESNQGPPAFRAGAIPSELDDALMASPALKAVGRGDVRWQDPGGMVRCDVSTWRGAGIVFS